MSGYSSSVSIVPILSALAGLPLVIIVVGLLVIVAVANRAEPDPSGRRAHVVYYFSAAFFSLWAAYLGAIIVVTGLLQLMGTHPSPSFGRELHPLGDAVARQVVIGGLVFLIAGASFLWHHHRGVANTDSGPTYRVAQSYSATISFSAILLVVVSTIVGIYALFGVVAPGVFQSSGSEASGRTAIVAFYLALAALSIRTAYGNLHPQTKRIETVVVEIEEP